MQETLRNSFVLKLVQTGKDPYFGVIPKKGPNKFRPYKKPPKFTSIQLQHQPLLIAF